MLASLPGMDPRDFPVWSKFDGVRSPKQFFDCKTFLGALRQVSYASMSDSSRFNLNGVCFDEERVVATDGHRLEITELRDLEGNAFASGIKMIVPIRSVRFLSGKVFDQEKTLTVWRDKGNFVVASGNKLFTTRLAEGDYPDYVRVIPDRAGSLDQKQKIVTVNRKKIIESVAAFNPFYTGRNVRHYGINITLNGKIDLHILHPDKGEMSLSVDCSSNNDLEFPLILNQGYLLDALRTGKSENVDITYYKEGAPVLFTGNRSSTDQYSILMPMRK
jgi:DNA polymerase-3 subunit beta